MTEDKLSQVHDIDSDVFTPRERAALRFATVMAQNDTAAADAVFEEVRRYFDDAQIVELGLTLSTFLGLNLFNNIFGIEPEAEVIENATGMPPAGDSTSPPLRAAASKPGGR